MTETWTMDGPYLTPPPAPNHRVWWIFLGGLVGTVVILAMLAMIYLQNRQSAPPPEGWQAYFEAHFSALEERVNANALQTQLSEINTRLQHLSETTVRTAPQAPECPPSTDPYGCATPTPTSTEPETGS